MRRAGLDLGTGALLAVLSMPLSTIASGPTVVAAAGPPAAGVEAVCAPAAPGYAQCLALRRTDIAARPAAAISPNTPPSGIRPCGPPERIRPAGRGRRLRAHRRGSRRLRPADRRTDLAVYRTQFSLPPCTTANGCFARSTSVASKGSYPVGNAGWGQEIALDIEMVSAACPNCGSCSSRPTAHR